MTRLSERELTRKVDDLDTDAPVDWLLVIGGNPAEAGAHHWDPDAGAYVNDRGHAIQPGDAPDGAVDVGGPT